MYRVAITRPAELLDRSVEMLKKEGFEVFAAPTIEIRKIKPFMAFSGSDYSVFASINSVKFGFEMIKDLHAILAKGTVIAIGPMTAQSLEDRGIDPILPEEYSSRGIIKLLSRMEIDGKKIVIFHSSKKGVLKGDLQKMGALVEDVPLYTIGIPRNLEGVRRLIEKGLNGEIDVFTFTCSSSFENLIQIAGARRRDLIDLMNSRVVASIGERTKRTIEAHGVEVKTMPGTFTFESMVVELKRYMGERFPDDRI